MNTANTHSPHAPQDLLHHHHAVECPVKCVQGVLYVRVSAHVYNTRRDYEVLAQAVLAVRESMQRQEGPEGQEERS